MDEREQKGLVIAATMKIQRSGNAFVVPSQTDQGNRYAVDGVAKTCSCPDFTLRQKACKHVHAVEFYLRREVVTSPSGTTTVTETAAVRVTYAQDWPKYNAAQTNEKAHFLKLLRALCDGVPTPPQGNGRPPLPVGDQIFSMAFKVYSGLSARRFSTDLREAAADGLVSDAPAYNSVIRYFEDEELTPILRELVTASALPLKAVETDFAIDSTGFTSTQLVGLWQATKYGSKRARQEHDWLKVHMVCGVNTNVIAAAEVTERNSQDSPEFPALISKTADHFNMERVEADKAYSSYRNLELVDARGAVPYIPFKSYAKGGSKSSVWNKLFHFYSMHRDEFLAIYHRRSNAETTVSMVKRVFGDKVRSKTRVAQINELFLMLLCHNLRCIVHAMYELGIEPSFATAGLRAQIGA